MRKLLICRNGRQPVLFYRNRIFFAPAAWSQHATATISTHDLPTFAGWWQGHDIGWRSRLDLLEQGTTEADERRARDEDRKALWQAFTEAGCAEGDAPPATAQAAPIGEALTFIAATLPLEDALGLPEQPNFPGTVDSHPNWRRRLRQAADAVLEEPAVAARLAILNNTCHIARKPE
jgi:4-alpha-glucanotransferase